MPILNKIAALDFPDKDLWVNEAQFGFAHIAPLLAAKPDANVLEIGCGSGLLLSLVGEQFPNATLTGVEPFGDGFASIKALNQFVQDQGVVIHNLGYETFTPTTQYDLIYLVNVFEHLEDWQDFLERLPDWLSDDGVCLILCPNYGFPYESHFRLPIIWNKALTARLFKNKIAMLEQRDNAHGLWSSLNFVKKSAVKRAAKSLPITLTDHIDVTTNMIKRLESDPEFAKRQKILGLFAKIALKLGLLKIMSLPVFHNIFPYMKLTITRRAQP